MLFYIWKSFYIRKSHCWQGNYFSKSQKQIQGREKELRKVETRTHDRTPQGQTMRTNQAVRHRQWAGPDTGGACPLSAHDEPSRDPIAFLRTISLPVYQILNSSFSMLRVEKLLHSIYRTSIDQLRGEGGGSSSGLTWTGLMFNTWKVGWMRMALGSWSLTAAANVVGWCRTTLILWGEPVVRGRVLMHSWPDCSDTGGVGSTQSTAILDSFNKKALLISCGK